LPGLELCFQVISYCFFLCGGGDLGWTVGLCPWKASALWLSYPPSPSYIIITGPVVLNFFIFSGTEVWPQDFVFAKQVFHHLSHTFSPFCSDYFGNAIYLSGLVSNHAPNLNSPNRWYCKSEPLAPGLVLILLSSLWSISFS
jgi:hypothetical protein